MNDIKPIETKYDGCRFRSRLEARWAVLFNAMGIEWEYEPEGYPLGDYGWYLPDFLIKNIAPCEFWFEVKPDHGGTKEAKDKAKALVSLTGKPLMMVAGQPETIGWGIVGSDRHFSSGMKWWSPFPMVALQIMKRSVINTGQPPFPVYEDMAVFAICGNCGTPWVSMWDSNGLCPGCACGASEKAHGKAVTKALSARFEYGDADRR